MSNNYLGDVNDVLKTLPFQTKNISLRDIKQHGNELNQPVKKWIAQHNNARSIDSRTLAFSSLAHNKNGNSMLFGVVADYRISYNSKYHQAVPYILLYDVCGVTYNHQIQYLTNHLWVDTNFDMMGSTHNYDLSIGDCVFIIGHVEQYHGWVKHMPCIKFSLDKNTKIYSSGYPYWINHHLYLIQYHHTHCLFSIKGFDFRIHLGDEINQKDLKSIKSQSLKIGYTADSILGHIVSTGQKLRTRSRNPKLVLHKPKDKNNLINHLSWMQMKKSVRIGKNRQATVLTTAKAVKQHPHKAYKVVKAKLEPALSKSFKQLCVWKRPLNYKNW